MSTLLITGGTGTTGSRVAHRLFREGHDVRIATRTPDRTGEVLFDWFKPDTHQPAMAGVDAIYLVAPTGALEVLDAMRAGLETALAAGIRRFVLLSASALPEDAPMMGQVHSFLRAQAPEWVVLRPSWFMQNFIGQHGASIRTADAIYSATGEGRVPFIDADDIAAVAARALLDGQMPSGELVLTGPVALSYGDVASTFSAALGRPIVHHALGVEAMTARLVQGGLGSAYAQLLAGLDAAIAAGTEDRTTDTVAHIIGRPPTSLATFAEAARDHWQRPAAA
jgi:uncharacterized protein YbjT (DUF2867 family)